MSSRHPTGIKVIGDCASPRFHPRGEEQQGGCADSLKQPAGHDDGGQKDQRVKIDNHPIWAKPIITRKSRPKFCNGGRPGACVMPRSMRKDIYVGSVRSPMAYVADAASWRDGQHVRVRGLVWFFHRENRITIRFRYVVANLETSRLESIGETATSWRGEYLGILPRCRFFPGSLILRAAFSLARLNKRGAFTLLRSIAESERLAFRLVFQPYSASLMMIHGMNRLFRRMTSGRITHLETFHDRRISNRAADAGRPTAAVVAGQLSLQAGCGFRRAQGG